MATNIELPESLRSFNEKFLPTRRNFIRIKTKTETPIAPWNSAIGGIPYWLKADTYPTNREGKPLLFLIQINCSELPDSSILPNNGLLQVFINDDDLYGVNFEQPTIR